RNHANRGGHRQSAFASRGQSIARGFGGVCLGGIMATNENRVCQNMEEDLVLYYYKELPGAEGAQVEAHIQDCQPCRLYFQEITFILPSTVIADDPPENFWTDYNREMRLKLSAVREKKTWWQNLVGLLQPWPRSAWAMAAVVALALTITLGKSWWQSPEPAP